MTFLPSSPSAVSILPFLRCFFLVLRRMPLIPGTGFMSLLLMGGGCRMGLGARVRQTGRPAAHIRIPVIPDACVQHRDAQTDTKEWEKHQLWVLRLTLKTGLLRFCFPNMFYLVNVNLTCECWVHWSRSSQVLYWEGRNPVRRRERVLTFLIQSGSCCQI